MPRVRNDQKLVSIALSMAVLPQLVYTVHFHERSSQSQQVTTRICTRHVPCAIHVFLCTCHYRPSLVFRCIISPVRRNLSGMEIAQRLVPFGRERRNQVTVPRCGLTPSLNSPTLPFTQKERKIPYQSIKRPKCLGGSYRHRHSPDAVRMPGRRSARRAG